MQNNETCEELKGHHLLNYHELGQVRQEWPSLDRARQGEVGGICAGKQSWYFKWFFNRVVRYIQNKRRQSLIYLSK